MNINLSISPAPSVVTNYLIVAAYEASAPATVVASQSFAAPHTGSQNVSFTNLNPVVHIIKIWENPTSSPTGTIRHQFIYDPSFQNAVIKDDLYLVVGTSSGLNAGATAYVNAGLIGFKFSIERRGFGTMAPASDYVFDGTTGTITLQQAGDTFQLGELFILRFQPQISTVSANVSVQQLFTGVEIRTANTTLTAANVEKLQLIQGAGDHLTITLPNLSDIPDFKMIPFSSEGGSHINATISTQGLDRISFMTQSLSSVFIAQSEQIWFFKTGGAYHVINPEGNFKTVGEIVMNYFMQEQNTLFCDGSVISRLTYPRLWAFVQTLDASELVNDADWNNVLLNNKGKFSTGDGSSTFRIPLLHTPGYLRGVDGVTRKAGSWQDNMIQSHSHKVGTTGDQSSVDPGKSIQRSSRAQDLYSDGTDVQGPYIQATGGTETTPKNIGIYFLIRI